jgi:hypothetical protein
MNRLSMKKHEFATHAGISPRTLSRWCKQQREPLRILRVKPKSSILSPLAIIYLCDYYSIPRPNKLKSTKITLVYR